MESIVKVKYKLRREYCRCCGRAFEKDEATKEKEKKINVADFMEYLPRTSDNAVYAEDYIDFISDCVFDELNYCLGSDEVAVVGAQESIKVLKVAYELLKKANVGIINEEFLQNYLIQYSA